MTPRSLSNNFGNVINAPSLRNLKLQRNLEIGDFFKAGNRRHLIKNQREKTRDTNHATLIMHLIALFPSAPFPEMHVLNAEVIDSWVKLNRCVINGITSTAPLDKSSMHFGYVLRYRNTPCNSTSRHEASSNGTLMFGLPIP